MYKKLLLGIATLLACSSNVKAQENVKNYDLNEVVVTASRMQLPLKSIPQKVEIISREKIQTLPANNAADLLKSITNLDIAQYPGTSSYVGLRGFAPSVHNRNYTLLLIDGKPAGTTNLTSIPTDFVERIEVIKGPYSVLYGSDAMGGVINIVTKAPSAKSEGSVALSVGNFAQTNFSAYASGRLSDKVRMSLGFSRKAQDKDYLIGSKNLFKITDVQKMILDEKSYGDRMTNTQFSINQFMGKLTYDINNAWSMNLNSIFVASNDVETPGNYWHSYGMSKQDFNRSNTYLDIKRETDDNVLLLSPYFSIYKENNFDNNTDAAFITSKETVKQYGAKLSDTHSWENVRIIGGVDIDANQILSQRFSDKITAINPYRPDHSIFATSAFLQGAYTTEKLFVNAGARYSYTSFTLEANEFLKNEKGTKGYSNFNPSFGIKYFIIPEITLHGSVGTAFFVPDAYKVAGMYKVGKTEYRGKADLKPEYATSFDFGFNIAKDEYVNLDVTYFQTFHRNKIVNDTRNKEYITFMNADKGNMNGLELMFSSNLARVFGCNSSDVELYANYTHLFKSTFDKRQADDTFVTKDLLYVRKNTANFGIAYNNRRGFTTRLNARYIGHRLENDWMVWDNLRPNIKAENYYQKGGYTDKDQILQHPSHLVLDWSAYYKVTPSSRVGVSVANLLDENYTEKDGYNMPGRSIMGHFSYSF